MTSFLNISSKILRTLAVLMLIVCTFSVHQSHAQEMIQIKAFDEGLKPLGNVKVGVNHGALVELNARGTAFAKLKKEDFPIKSIAIGDNTLEAASWNLSKGVLEITIRKKSYRDVTLVLKNMNNEVLGRQAFTYKGAKTISSTTDVTGAANLPLALNDRINDPNQFVVQGYKPKSVALSGTQYILKVEPVNPVQQPAVAKVEEIKTNIEPSPNLQTSILANIDSIQSLAQFYAFLKGVKMGDLSPEGRSQIDARFAELLSEVESSQSDSTSFITNITDSTVVQSDLKNLLNEVKRESKRLNSQKSEFDDKIRLVREKLNQGFENLSEEARSELLSDLNLLEELLASNETDFTENQSNYQAMITDLKNRFFDMEKLEGQLTASEKKRLEEKKLYQQRMLAISGVVLLFALLLILLLFLRSKLKKQQKQLILANDSVKNINQNLESIVSQRTQLLEKTYKELDMVLYRASHDLRAPLCSITGLSNLISLNSNDGELTDLIVKTNNQMDKLLKKLSTISEIHQPGTFSEIQVANLVNEVVERFDAVVKQKNINLTVICDPNLTIISIPFLLEVTLHSLIENAIFFANVKHGKGGEVVLKVNHIDSNLEIEVYDNGIGVNETSVTHLFDMFYIGTELSKGNGLGLYIVQKSVNVLKGKIHIDSEHGEYTRITVSVPIDDSQGHTLDFLDQNALMHYN